MHIYEVNTFIWYLSLVWIFRNLQEKGRQQFKEKLHTRLQVSTLF